MKRTFVVLVLIGSIAAVAASQVTLTYDVAVTFTDGPHASAFPVGELATVTYTLDPAAVDSQADPQRGVFPGAVLALSITFPNLGIFANAGPAGLAQTFNNAGTCSISDQVFLFGGPITSASTVGGQAITSLEVDFLSDFVPTTAPPPSMLTSDALPLTHLPMIHSFARIEIAGVDTTVNFSARPAIRIQVLMEAVERRVTLGVLTRARADRLIDKLNDAIRDIGRGHDSAACADIAVFIERVNGYIDSGALNRAGVNLVEEARDIRALLRCS